MWTYDELKQSLAFPEAVDSTMLSTFACPTKFFQEFILKRVPAGRSIDLHAGGLAARAFEVIRRGVFMDGLSLEEAKFQAWREFLVGWPIGLDPKEGSYKDFVNVWSAVEAYFKEYPPREDYFQPYIQADGSPSVEFKFAIPTRVLHPATGDPIFFAGRADLLAQNEPGTCYVLDEKTTKAIGPSWPYQWDMRGQFYGYVHAARTIGFPCVGSVTRGIAIQQTQFTFGEKVLLINKSQTDRWWENAQKKIERMVDSYINTCLVVAEAESCGDPIEDCFPRVRECWDMAYNDLCTNYGGCQFRDLCVSEVPWELCYGWERRVWNPLAQDPTSESEDRMSAMGMMSIDELMEGM